MASSGTYNKIKSLLLHSLKTLKQLHLNVSTKLWYRRAFSNSVRSRVAASPRESIGISEAIHLQARSRNSIAKQKASSRVSFTISQRPAVS